MALFADRQDAGGRLAADLRARPAPVDVERLVVGLPRGGVLVAAKVALALGCPLDVLVVRKIGHPACPELGLGALAETGERVLNHALMHRLRVPAESVDSVTDAERAEARRRVVRYRGGRPPAEVRGREVLIVDDGLATGFTALVAASSVRARGAARVVVAVPVGSAETVALLRTVADDVVCLADPPGLHAVGEAYRWFGDTGDDEVLAALAGAGSVPGRPVTGEPSCDA